MYDYYTFPVNEYSKEEAMAQFCSVQKETMKDNGRNRLIAWIDDVYYALVRKC